eukprot:11813_1
MKPRRPCRTSTKDESNQKDTVYMPKSAINLLQLHNKPPSFTSNSKRMIDYKSPIDDKYYIIICPCPTAHLKDYIYFYDISNDTFLQKYEYPSYIKVKPEPELPSHAKNDDSVSSFSHFGIAIDKNTNLLYLVTMNHLKTNSFHILNLTTNKWYICKVKKSQIHKHFNEIDDCIRSVHIANDSLFVLSEFNLYKYCLNTKTFQCSIKHRNASSLLYIEKVNKFLFQNEIRGKAKWYLINANDIDENIIFDKTLELKLKKKYRNDMDWNSKYYKSIHSIKTIFYAFEYLLFFIQSNAKGRPNRTTYIYDLFTNKWYDRMNEGYFRDTWDIAYFSYMNSILVTINNKVYMFKKNINKKME